MRIAREEPVSPGLVTAGFENYSFQHVALPEIDLRHVSLGVEFLGKQLAAPLLISSMTGGTPEAGDINRRLAAAAQKFGLALALGSARAAIDDPALAPTFRVRDLAPDILLLANLGAVQLNCGYGYSECMRAIEMAQADALILHLNPLQEALQPGGDANFAGLLHKIEDLCRQLPVPVVVKEVGWGLSAEVAGKLVEAGVSALDIAGAGGTSWSEIEGFRIQDDALRQVALDFREWGIPTTEAIRQVRRVCTGTPLIGSGGIRTGIDLAKAIALGADIGGVALPFLKAASHSEEALHTDIRRFLEGLHIAMFCIGAQNIRELQSTRHLIQTLSRPGGEPIG